MSKRKSTKSGEHVCIPKIGQYPVHPGGTCYLICHLYGFTDMSWLYFAKIKSDMVKFVPDLLGFLKRKGVKVKYICCVNAGEHMSKLRTSCQK